MKKPRPAAPAPAPEPTEAQIQHEAYRLWLEAGRPAGRDLEHWLAARELLRHRHGRAPAGSSAAHAAAAPAA
jgi:hypothetical protein